MIRYLRTLAGKISVSILLFGVLQSTALAWGYSGSSTISTVVIDIAEGIITVKGATVWGNPDGCATSGIVVIQMSGNYYKDAEATVLAAYATGTSIQFWLNGCAYSPGGGNAPLVTAVSVPQ